jgi:MerR family transcriptional regulator, light-induced transcriptional regulator
MYTIKQAAALAGVGAPLIRAWERRYGIVAPPRTPSGYRLYDDQMVATLRAMRALTEAGWSAGQAAQGILAHELPVEEWAEHAPRSVPDPRPPRSGSMTDPVTALVDAAALYDAATVEAALDEMFSRGSFESIVDDLVMPAAVALGEAWAAGRVEVAAEHMASAAIGRRLATAFGAASNPRDAPQVAVGLPPGSRHELGVLAFAITLRRRAIGVLYLGADVPIDSWVDVVRRSSVRAAVVGVVTDADIHPAEEVVSAIERADQDVVVVLGGSRAARVDRSDRTILLEAARLTSAAEELERTLSGR